MSAYEEQLVLALRQIRDYIDNTEANPLMLPWIRTRADEALHWQQAPPPPHPVPPATIETYSGPGVLTRWLRRRGVSR